MNRAMILMMATLVATCALPRRAVAGTSASVGVGAAVPTGPFRSVSNGAIVVEIGLRHMFHPAVGVGVSASRSGFKGSDLLAAEREDLSGLASTVSLTTRSYCAYALAALPLGRLTPYARGGVGAYNASLMLQSLDWAADEGVRETGVLGGAGLLWGVTPHLEFGLDATWHRYGDGHRGMDVSWVSATVQAVYTVPGFGPGLLH